MERVNGIAGVFLRASDADALSAWYAEHLGLGAPPAEYDAEVWMQQPGRRCSRRSGPRTGRARTRSHRLGHRVDDLDAIVKQLRAAGIEVDAEDYPNGRFAQLTDPEGNAVQLWEPA